MNQILLFEYAQLESPGAANAWAFGELRLRGASDAAAQFAVHYVSRVFGQLRRVSFPELLQLDMLEAPEYARETIWVKAPGEAFMDRAVAYAYVLPDFLDLPPIPSGRFQR